MSVEAELQSLQRISDRLVSTSNDDLQRVLEGLLPKLLPMSNNAALRDKQVIPILTHILRRVKLLKIVLPLDKLISLLRQDMLPFCCNLAMAFIDAAVQYQPSESRKICAQPLISVFNGFPMFTPQSNALCYYSLFCIEPLSMDISIDIETKNSLGDWLMDIALAQPGIIQNSPGSVQPGLSAERLGRLLAKKSEWGLNDLRQYKLALIKSISQHWLPTQCSVAIAIICSCDTDTEVATQAVFKMNGARSILTDIIINPQPVLDLLLNLCFPLTQNMKAHQNHPFLHQRMTLRDSVKCAILKWICKEMSEYVIVAGKSVIQLVFTEMFKSSATGSMSMIYTSHTFELTAILAEKMSEEMITPVAPILLQCVKKALQPFITLLSVHTATSVDSEASVSTRESCYRIIEIVSKFCPKIAISDPDLLILLFHLLDCEENNRAIIRLYTALGELRNAYQKLCNVKALGTASLAELISRSRTSLEPKKR